MNIIQIIIYEHYTNNNTNNDTNNKFNKNIYLYEELDIKHHHIQEYDVPQTNLLKYCKIN
mgnify:CR=1 FL=1